MPRVVLIFAAEGEFRNERAFSQRRAIFAAAKLGYCAAKWHTSAKGVFRSCETPCKMRLSLRKLKIWRFGDFAAAKWSYCAAKWHMSAKRWFRRGGCWAAKFISQRRAIFAAKPWFRRGHVRAAKFRRPLKFHSFELLFGPLRPSFIFFAIIPTKDHSKRGSYL